MNDLTVLNSNSRLRVHPQVAWRELDQHVFAVTPDNRQHELAGVVELCVWARLAQTSLSLSEVIDVVVTEFDVAHDVATSDLTEFLTECAEAQLVEVVA